MTSKTILTAATIIAFFCAYTFSYSQACGGMSSSSTGKDKSGTTAKSTSTAGTTSSAEKTSGVGKSEQQKDTVAYTCPMHPEVQSDKPGKCPKCGMDLVKKSDTSGMKMKWGMMGGMSDMNKTESKEKNKTANDSIKKDAVVYTCSMHPEVKMDKPGKCPKCGMELIRKK